MSKTTDTAQPGITPQYLIERIRSLEGQKADLLQKAQNMLAAAQRANQELIAQANAVHGAIQQCEELLGMLAEANAPPAGTPEIKPNPVDKLVKETATERARRKAEQRRAVKAVKKVPVKPTASLMGRITPEDDGTAGAPAAGATAA